MNEPSGGGSPVQDAERIEVIDGLRGFTLCGILFVNIMWFKAPGGSPAPATRGRRSIALPSQP